MEYEALKCDCKFTTKKGKHKLYCKTHNQYLIYVYVMNGEHRYVCQVGEDNLYEQIADGEGKHNTLEE